MDVTIEQLLLGASILLLLSVLAGTASGRLGVPALLLFLAIGMLAGSDGPGGIHFDDPFLAQSIGVVALAFILFAGGLDTDWTTVRSQLGRGLALSTIGVAITACLVGVFATVAVGFSWLEGLLIGAIVSSTDAAAVFAVMRSRSVRLRDPLKPLLELESGSNDPMAVFLTIGLISLMTGASASVIDLVVMFLRQMVVGAAIGYGSGKLIVELVNRLRLEYEGLYPVLTLSLVLLTYSGSASLGGNGFLAVYLAGLVMGNRDFIHKRSLLRFHDGLAWLMQIAMFLVLGLQVFPSQLFPVAGIGLSFALFLMLCARPVAVFLPLALTTLSMREKTMVAWVGLRGAVPIILATFPLLAGLPQAPMMFNLVFFIVLTSVLLQGTSIPLVARWLRVDEPAGRLVNAPPARDVSGDLKSSLIEVTIPHESAAVGKQLLDLGLPKEALIILIGRKGRCFVPDGSTVLEADDVLLVSADRESFTLVRGILTESGEDRRD
ncbi:MAG: potassium/proton antiporter [Nitrospira sp.]|nr:potassium/proton antiporter [Nitrospira sp.]MCP9443256.1 potassium/proton antiporter [Nitrospira sp.]